MPVKDVLIQLLWSRTFVLAGMKKNVTFVKIVASICASKLKERSQKQKKELNQGEEESSE